MSFASLEFLKPARGAFSEFRSYPESAWETGGGEGMILSQGAAFKVDGGESVLDKANRSSYTLIKYGIEEA